MFMPFLCFLGDERDLPSSQELFQYLLVEMVSLFPLASNISIHLSKREQFDRNSLLAMLGSTRKNRIPCLRFLMVEVVNVSKCIVIAIFAHLIC